MDLYPDPPTVAQIKTLDDAQHVGDIPLNPLLNPLASTTLGTRLSIPAPVDDPAAVPIPQPPIP